MSHTAVAHAVMEGDGAYNRHAKLQAGGIAIALPFLERAVANLQVDDDDQAVVVADYGSSQGKNSLAPMRLAIEKLRPRLGPHRPIFVFHIDQPSNDFNTLFEVLDADPDTYTLARKNIFPCAIGRSFYQRVLPSESVHLGWCSYAAVWLSRAPGPVSGHFIPLRRTNPERAAFEHQAAQDWKAFLSFRAAELRPGGRLIVILPARNDEGVTGFEDFMDHANAVLAGMVDDGALRAQERNRMVLGTFPRRNRDLLAPFEPAGHFEGLTVENCDLFPVPDPAWADYRRNGNNQELATRHAGFFRSAFIPSLTLALNKAHDAERSWVFADRFEDGLKRRLVEHPVPLHSFVQTLVVAKRTSSVFADCQRA